MFNGNNCTQILDFSGRSISASGWVLDLNRQTGSYVLDVSNIADIQIKIGYRHTTRAQCP